MENKKNKLSLSVNHLKGVGPKTAIMLGTRGIKTIEDLFWFLPVRYNNKSTVKKITELKEGEKATIIARVITSRSLFFHNSHKKAYEALVEDDTGNISLKWFQWVSEYLKKVCKKNNMLMLSGNITRFGNKLQMVHPEIHILENENKEGDCKKITAVYPEIEGIKQGTFRILVERAFEEYGMHVKSILKKSDENEYGLIALHEAFSKLHFPDEDLLNNTATDDCWKKIYYNRLIFEEYLMFQLAVLIKKKGFKNRKGISFKSNGAYYKKFMENLPFNFTSAQNRVIKEIEKDMCSGLPMNRLLQGDVGSGKTICAIVALLIVLDSGYQAVLMAPTEILAEQHFLAMRKYFKEMGISPVFLRGNMGAERKNIIEKIKDGKAKIIIGTHAIIEKDVVFKNLGLVVIDEQHRFGVIQRKLLREKDSLEYLCLNDKEDGIFEFNAQKLKINKDITPDALVMTATPIPRTLSMIIYGDLDISIIDEIPSGRQKISTKVLQDKDKAFAYRTVENELKKGFQAYIVCPLIEESKKIELLNAKEMSSFLQSSVFPEYRIGLLHGRMKPEEKEDIMIGFKNRKIDVLVCTTVIEVGIDIPNVTIIVIENAERFGLSQLHQLRGRVGRGSFPSKCILITSAKKTTIATKRLKIMEETTDGFRISEEDMKLRGPGDVLGVRQAGLPDFRVGNIINDMNTMINARKIAEKIINKISICEAEKIHEIFGK